MTVFRDGRAVAERIAEDLTRDRLVEDIVGRNVEIEARAQSADDERAVALEVEGLTGGVVESVDLQVRKGEILGLAGLAGSGRSQLLHLIFGEAKRDRGTIRLDGHPLRINRPGDAIAAGIALVPRERWLEAMFPDLSVRENLTLGNTRDHARGPAISRRSERRSAAAAIEQFGIRVASPDVAVATLSGGNQQKVSLARWLRLQPRVLLLDEPTQGVDVGARADIWRLIEAAAAAGTATILVSSDLEELTHLSDRVVVLKDGRKAGEIVGPGLDPDDVNESLHALDVAT